MSRKLCVTTVALFSAPHALGATYSRFGPAVLATCISSTLCIGQFRSMVGADLEATSRSRLFCRYVRPYRTHLRWVYPSFFPFRGC
jgi:hypothetical protein